MLRARVCDSAGPRWWRALAIMGTLPLAAIAVALPWSVVPRMVVTLLGMAWLSVGRLVVPRLKPRPCQVLIESGAIVLKKAGLSSQRVRASDIRAASTALLTNHGYAIALVRHEEGEPPLWLEVETQADLDQVQRALGVAHAGFGRLEWPPRRGVFHTRATVIDLLASLGWLATIVAVTLGATEVALALVLPVVPLTLMAMMVAAAPRRTRQILALTPYGIDAAVAGRSGLLHWDTVLNAIVEGDHLLLRTRDQSLRVAMPGALSREREYFAAQIRSASRRARGEGPPAPDMPASLAILAPRDEGARAWLGRLDATAAAMAQGRGYRHGGVDSGDLWAALESPDAPAALRAAAARILARVAPEQAGERIAEALSKEHDGWTKARIRLALEEDLDVAARELERLEAARTSPPR